MFSFFIYFQLIFGKNEARIFAVIDARKLEVLREIIQKKPNDFFESKLLEEKLNKLTLVKKNYKNSLVLKQEKNKNQFD